MAMISSLGARFLELDLQFSLYKSMKIKEQTLDWICKIQPAHCVVNLVQIIGVTKWYECGVNRNTDFELWTHEDADVFFKHF